MFIKAGENIKNRMVTKMPESQNTEWKSKWKDEYLEWICGYANAQGGKIYIGCDDEGNVIGLSNARKLLEDIPNKIRDAMELLTKCPQKMCNGNMGRKNDAHWRHFMDHINRFRFKAVAERRQ